MEHIQLQNSGAKTSALPPLPACPPLDESFVRAECIDIGRVRLESFVPARAPYLCGDESAPALVFVPGLGMDALGFLRQLPLGSITRVHLFQTPNEAFDGESGLGHFAHAVEAFIAARKLDCQPGGVVLAGCSMGGAVSLATAIRGKVKLRGLVLIGTFGNCAHLGFIERHFRSLIHIVPLGIARRVARWVVGNTHFFGKIKPDEADWMVSCKLERTRDYYVRAVMSLTRQNQLAAARNLKVPALVLHGTKDHVLPYAAGVELAQTIPGARLVAVKDSGHALFFTDSGEVNQAIAEFISNLAVNS